MRALKIITGHVIYNPAYTYKFQLKTTKVGIIAIQRLFWEGGITARQEPLNQTMVVGPLVGPSKTLLCISFERL